jgi:hypothetical protein
MELLRFEPKAPRITAIRESFVCGGVVRNKLLVNIRCREGKTKGGESGCDSSRKFSRVSTASDGISILTLGALR